MTLMFLPLIKTARHLFDCHFRTIANFSKRAGNQSFRGSQSECRDPERVRGKQYGSDP